MHSGQSGLHATRATGYSIHSNAYSSLVKDCSCVEQVELKVQQGWLWMYLLCRASMFIMKGLGFGLKKFDLL